MTINAKSILVVDRSHITGLTLRAAISKIGSTTHVFGSIPPALELLKRKKVDAVVIVFDFDKPTKDFCNTAKEMGVPVIYTSASFDPLDARQYGFQVAFTGLSKSPRMLVPYRDARA